MSVPKGAVMDILIAVIIGLVLFFIAPGGKNPLLDKVSYIGGLSFCAYAVIVIVRWVINRPPG